MYAPYVPKAYPSTAKSTPTGASAGWNAAATTGALAAPPIFAFEPTAKKKYGARIILATKNIRPTWIIIQTKPTANNPGLWKIYMIFMLIPIVATRM